jgi:hypothetical protein
LRLFLKVFIRELPVTLCGALVLFLFVVLVLVFHEDADLPPTVWPILFVFTFIGANVLILRDAIKEEIKSPSGTHLSEFSQAVRQFAKKEGMRFVRASPRLYRASLKRGNSLLDVEIATDDGFHRADVLVLARITVHPNTRPAAAECITRANCSLAIGCSLELDMLRGKLRSQVNLDAQRGGLTEEVLKSALRLAAFNLNTHISGVMDVVKAGTPRRTLTLRKRRWKGKQ